jgi:hypothetical protein
MPSRVSSRSVGVEAERQLIIGMAGHGDFLRQIEPILKPELLKNQFARTVAEWCASYHQQYGRAPGRDLEDLFRAALREGLPKAEAELIELFLEDLSQRVEEGEFDNWNTEFHLDRAEEYLRGRSLEMLREDLGSLLVAGDVSKAEAEIGRFGLVRRPGIDWINPFIDEEMIRDSFEHVSEAMIRLPDAAGDLINEFLTRDSLVAFMGPEKRGKSWWIEEIAMRANASRLNVAHFEVGDMSRRQVIRRQHVYLAGRSNEERYSGLIRVPVLDCQFNQNGSCRLDRRVGRGRLMDWETGEEIEHPNGYLPCSICSDGAGNPYWKPCVWYKDRPPCDPLTWVEGIQLGRRWFEQRAMGRQLRLRVSPNSTMSVTDIAAVLDTWEGFDGWTPDVITIDYADILAPEPGGDRDSNRDKQDRNWRMLRQLSQKRHCLVVTATQADSASYEAGLLRPKNFSEDKRKLGHATAVIGLNQTEAEKTRSLMRLNVVLARDAEYDVRRTVTILQSLKQGRPLLDSFWTSAGEIEEEQED